jgi:hypothetical protein
LEPIPYPTLNPTLEPYLIHPTPYTLHLKPIPYTFNVKPGSMGKERDVNGCDKADPCDPCNVCQFHVAAWEQQQGASYSGWLHAHDEPPPAHVAKNDDETMRRERMKAVIAGGGCRPSTLNPKP